MTHSPTPAELLALKTAHAALRESKHPAYDIVSQVVFALGRRQLLQSPETTAELHQLEEDLTGAYLARWEEEQDNARLRLALKSAQRGRRKLRARVAELERERHTTNDAVAEAHLALATKEPAEPASPAQQAAADIQAMHDPTVIGYIVGVDWLSLTLRPRTLPDWQAWLDRLDADLAHVTHRGATSTAKGSWNGVPVAVQAHGVGALLAAARTTTGSGAV